jgi:16S rRNA A1518/A1519 N6-dimethyltransferase RsmA/KsgA/DIM1 with predicted DNA glycosylase/AP lyase activity
LCSAGLAGTVIEVGPGTGGLTDMLLQKPIASLHLIETKRWIFSKSQTGSDISVQLAS